MERTPVQSSNLVSVGYDPDAQVVEVEFKNGAVYQYQGVPSEVHTELMAAPSVGSYFIREIRNAYPARAVR